MSLTRMKQGEDKVLTVALLGPGQTPIDLTVATDIRVELRKSSDNAILDRFSLTANSGYGFLEVGTGGGNTHKIDIYIKRANSIDYPENSTAGVSVLVQFTDGDQPDGFLHQEFDFPAVLRIDKGYTTDEPIP